MKLIKKFFNTTVKPALEPLAKVIIFGLVGVTMYFAVAMYYLKYVVNLSSNPNAPNLGYNFDTAILSATLGGFAMIGGFLNQKPSSVKKDLINSGRGFLTSAVFATVFSFILPVGIAGKPEQGFGFYLILIVAMVSMLLSVVGLTFGVTLLIPCLWKLGRNK